LQETGDSPGLDIEGRARQVLGLTDYEREPRALAFRAWQQWRAENFAPRVPYTGAFLLPMGRIDDLDRIRKSVAQVIARHEALRSRLGLENGVPILLPASPAPLDCVRVTAAELNTYRQGGPAPTLAGFFAPPIELMEQPGFRARAYADEDGNLTLAILMHHYFGDAWSSQILRRELEGIFAGQTLPPVESQYSDYALFQRRGLDKSLTRHLTYWHGYLRDAPPSRLPYDVEHAGGDMLGRVRFLLEGEVLKKLSLISRQERISLGVFCFAAFQLALARWCGVREIVSGVIIANRIRPQFRGTIGYLTSAIALRSAFTTDTSFKAILPILAKDLYNGIAYQDLSLEHYDEIFSPPGPFCVPRFNFTPRQEGFMAGGKEPPLPVITGIEKMADVRKNSAYPDLHLLLLEYPDGLAGRFIHGKRLSFDRIAALIGLYKDNLKSLAADPGQALGAFL
jgi:hypothetical protein